MPDTSGPEFQGEFPKGSGLWGFPRCVLPARPGSFRRLIRNLRTGEAGAVAARLQGRPLCTCGHAIADHDGLQQRGKCRADGCWCRRAKVAK